VLNANVIVDDRWRESCKVLLELLYGNVFAKYSVLITSVSSIEKELIHQYAHNLLKNRR
jgi:hypothetical protein